MNAVAQVVVAVLLILVQVVLEVAEVLHLPVRLVLLVIRVRLEPLLEAVVQDQLIVVEVQKHRVVILQQVIVIPVLLPMVLLVLLHVVILQLRQVAVALGVVIFFDYITCCRYFICNLSAAGICNAPTIYQLVHYTLFVAGGRCFYVFQLYSRKKFHSFPYLYESFYP